MPNLLLVMLGGAAGAGLRYGAGQAALRAFGAGFPWGTLIVNMTGSLAIGVLAAVLLEDGVGGDRAAWLLLVVGGLGGFTTFSSLSLEMLSMAQRGQFVAAFAYAAGSVIAGLALAAGGFAIGRAAA
ncbi:CrcB family protein [Sphingosinicella sp. BN140058]|uniref:fluoride efflux transporter FluC n=1 Tax=Sphingosinicella sp. BN140058 TaxID=1892855 RepID=UPI001011B996|nr:CrcB family protein [Sphingosinicella sp. BN140058]QAY77341.1 fluoride efflux transporter CrcB [Sphingosinicella sp. BN140058]